MTDGAATHRPASEAASLTTEMDRATEERVAAYEQHFAMSRAEAIGEVRDLFGSDCQRLADTPAAEVTWLDIGMLTERDPEAARELWSRVQAQARDELATGHRAAAALEYRSDLWERAQFLAIREEFRSQWEPCGGIDDALIDALALAYSGLLTWSGRLHLRGEVESAPAAGGRRDRSSWQPPRVSDIEAVEQAAAMADRFHRMFTRTLRALRDLRRYSPVIVQHANQVNIAEQQVNLGSQ